MLPKESITKSYPKLWLTKAHKSCSTPGNICVINSAKPRNAKDPESLVYCIVSLLWPTFFLCLSKMSRMHWTNLLQVRSSKAYLLKVPDIFALNMSHAAALKLHFLTVETLSMCSITWSGDWEEVDNEASA